MASNAKKEPRTGNPAANPNQQVFRRERSFVLQRPASQVIGKGAPFHQRERSFVRESGGNFNNFRGDRGDQQHQQPINRNDGANSGNGNKVRSRPQSMIVSNDGSPQEPVARAKPNMEIYRPPSVREGTFSGRAQLQQQQQQQPRLVKSKTMLDMGSGGNSKENVKFSTPVQRQNPPMKQFVLQRSKSSGNPLVEKAGGSPTINQQKDPALSPTNGASSIAHNNQAENANLPDLHMFSDSTARQLLTKIAIDPDGVSSRMIMEGVKIIFDLVVESSRYVSSIGRLCFYVIEKETKATFLESLLNQCQELFQERDHCLRTVAPDSGGLFPQRWVAFINFLNEIYLQLKRRSTINNTVKTNTTSNNSRPTPDLIILALLAESCLVTLKQSPQFSLEELECLFFVLTGIGRNLENELPFKMKVIWTAIRDAFLEMNFPNHQRILLQLVELRAAKWQLPATAVTYYYPSISDSSSSS